MSCNFLPSFGIVSCYSLKNLVVVESTKFACNFYPRFVLTPNSFNSIKLFIIGNWDRVMNYISNCINHPEQNDQQSFLIILNFLLLLFNLLLFRKFFLAWIIFIGLFFCFNSISNLIPLFVKHIALISN